MSKNRWKCFGHSWKIIFACLEVFWIILKRCSNSEHLLKFMKSSRISLQEKNSFMKVIVIARLIHVKKCRANWKWFVLFCCFYKTQKWMKMCLKMMLKICWKRLGHFWKIVLDSLEKFFFSKICSNILRNILLWIFIYHSPRNFQFFDKTIKLPILEN